MSGAASLRVEEDEQLRARSRERSSRRERGSLSLSLAPFFFCACSFEQSIFHFFPFKLLGQDRSFSLFAFLLRSRLARGHGPARFPLLAASSSSELLSLRSPAAAANNQPLVGGEEDPRCRRRRRRISTFLLLLFGVAPPWRPRGPHGRGSLGEAAALQRDRASV